MRPLCCVTFNIKIEDLIFPDGMNEDGRNFMHTRGIYYSNFGDLIDGCVDMGNGKVKVWHTCTKLDKDGKCSIYDHRPVICKEWECTGNVDGEKCTFCEDR